jgi:DNA-binding MarR family transcriptional regulator
MTRGAISKLIDRLVAKDLVSVRSDARDGRAQVIILRASGRRLVPKLAALADENDAQAFGHLDQEQRSFLLMTLEGIVGYLGIRGAPVD